MTAFSINFEHHFNYYNFFNSEETVDNFLAVVENSFVPTKSVEVQGSFSLINYQPPESEFSVEVIDKRAWMTDVFGYISLTNMLKEV